MLAFVIKGGPEVVEVEDQQFELTTTSQVERTYLVKAADADAAHKRLRRFIEDPEMVRPDLVELIPERTTDTTGQKVKTDSIKPVKAPLAAVDEATG